MEVVKFLGKGPGLALLLGMMIAVLGVVIFLARRSSKKEYTGRITFPVLFMEIAFVFLIILLGFKKGSANTVGPEVVPLLWIIGIFAFSIILLVKALLGHEEKDPEWGNIKVTITYILFTILYLIIMQYLGYYISTVLFLIGGMYYLTYRNWKVMISLTAGWLVFSYLAFYKLLYVPLPQGKLISWIFG